MQLAQLTEENAIPPVDMGTYNAGFSAFNDVATVLGILCFLALTTAWIAALYGSFTRKDLKHERWMWFFLILFFPFVMFFYFFMENRKTWGVISLIAVALLIIAPVLLSFMALPVR